MKARIVSSFGVVLLLTTSSPTLRGATERVESQATPVLHCADLGMIALPEAIITSATVIPAEGSVPAYCRVSATVEPETDIAVRLPDTWRRRLLHIGGSGFDGLIPNLNRNALELQTGYALTASNGGHRDPTGGPTRFLDNPPLIEDYAHAAIEKTVRAAKAIIEVYYGRRPRYSYFSGCSAGGRGAFNAAANYGEEYDGVVAGAPTRNMSGMVSRWAQAGQLMAPSAAKLASLYQAQLAQCDGGDGLIDGVIGNAAACRFDVSTLRCPAGVDSDSCLTDGEIEVVENLRSDLTLANGRVVYSRYGLGNPGTGFGVFARAAPGGPTVAAFFGAAFLRYIVYNDPAYDPATYDVDNDFRTAVTAFERTYDFSAATIPLARFLRKGKKIIVWHGAEDTLMSHVDTIRSFEGMEEAADRGRRNARLYIAPGVEHCGGGPGVNRFDMIGALADWVEKGREPDALLASRTDASGTVLFTRPLCVYPAYPRYEGHGDPNGASSFRCVHPKRQR